MTATETNFDCGWRVHVWKGKSSRRTRTSPESKSTDEERKEKAPDPSPSKVRADLRLNVFISKDSTSNLASCVLNENWGDENANLYKYIDYTWRSALFNRQVFAFTDKTDKECLVFHSGLQRWHDGEFIYLVLVPNDDKTKAQKWRIASAPNPDWSFKIAGDLLQYVDGDRSRLPQRCRFYNDPSELLFDTRCDINVDWVKSIESCKQRIQQEIVSCLLRHDRRMSPLGQDIEGNLPPESSMNGGAQSERLRFAHEQLTARGYSIPDATEMRALFQASFATSEKIVKANPYFVVPQGFVDSKKGECRLELLLPIFVSVDSNLGPSSGMSSESTKIRLCFALALQREESYNGYKAMSILTPDMAYTNARLVGLVNSAWLLAAAWPDYYSSPLLMTRNPPARRSAMPAGMGLGSPMGMTRNQSAPLMNDYGGAFGHPSGRPRMERVLPPSQISAPARFGRGGKPPGLSPPDMGRSMPASLSAQKEEDLTRRSLFVRNIPADWTEDTIKEKFSQYGGVVRITILPNRNKESSLQLCLIEMKSSREAINAQNDLHDEENEDGLKVQKQRGRAPRPQMMTRTQSADDMLTTPVDPSADWRSRRMMSQSEATVVPMPKLTLRIDNLKPHETAVTLRDYLQLLDIQDSDVEWINVYHPDNYAFVRFKTPKDVARAYEIFMSKPHLQYTFRIVKNPKSSKDEAFWKFSANNERLDPQLSDLLERAQYGETFYSNPRDEQKSPRITRYDGHLGSWFSPETQSARPLIRVQIFSWRRKRRWGNSRLRRNTAQSSPATIQRSVSQDNSPEQKSREEHTSMPAHVRGSLIPIVDDAEANESKEQPRRSLNPNATAFNPHAVKNLRKKPAVVDDEDPIDMYPGATFVPHHNPEHNPVDIGRGSQTWNALERKFGRLPGWEISEILEWPAELDAPRDDSLIRQEAWFIGLPGQVEILEKKGFIGRNADHGRGRNAQYTLWHSTAAGLNAFGEADVNQQIAFVFCDVYLKRHELNHLHEDKFVRIAAPSPSGLVRSIVPKDIFHISQRRVGH